MKSNSSTTQARRGLMLAVCALSLFVPGAVPAFAQPTTASVAGTIVDASEAAVPAAVVMVRSLETGVERSVPTDASGYYVIPALPRDHIPLPSARQHATESSKLT